MGEVGADRRAADVRGEGGADSPSLSALESAG